MGGKAMKYFYRIDKAGETTSRLNLFFSLAGMVGGLFLGWVLDLIPRSGTGREKQKGLPRRDSVAARFKERAA
jgi:hypothetical protein